MSSKPISINRRVITHDGVVRSMQAATELAESLGIHVCVAVVDSSGTLVGLLRMPQAFNISGEMAIKKAQSAAAVGLPADRVEAVLSQEAPRVREGLLLSGFNLIRGGLPLFDGDALIGAVGVSGGSETQDVACADAAASALIQE